jgi:hypothetical protein
MTVRGARRVAKRPIAKSETMAECFLCEDCGWVCESHPERPRRGVYACGYGSAWSPSAATVRIAAVAPSTG